VNTPQVNPDIAFLNLDAAALCPPGGDGGTADPLPHIACSVRPHAAPYALRRCSSLRVS